MGWSVTAATVYHEIAQEISDFVVLTDPKQGALKPFTALGFNFVSGLSVLLGVIVILSAELSNLDTGMILAYGGGIYLQIAASECMPKIYNAATSVQLRLIGFFAFFVGALAIGLVLLDHKHCEAGGGHEGHNHGGH
jgi:zinc transporter ZupT